ncbi:MAG TPA: glycosyltransferase [Balneola sp.]|jgi:O-antigen biosynthesis protein|nr:glycosyltransferase [Bacteroidota bacterium]MAC04322.1 glycosyltransferase [Balneola sp.]MAO78337.1 glycosyltransferase [Balneola sp.]MBF64338.1 glycosyltransferase [Balneola sp.]HAH51125.1 glycosyltransferase [Balneola sp.]|tara:strand:+ start:843 stop:2087 length:1245 start_codon:yes stop_codon:yes gene_type:complete
MFANQRVLIIGTVWPEPDSSAAGSRMMQLIAFFKEEGASVTFASSASNFEYSEDLKSLDIETELTKINDSGFDEFIKKLNPQVVLFDRFMTEEQFGWRIAEQCPDAIRVLDTEDLHSLRYGRHKALKLGRTFTERDLYSDKARREIASIYRCDLSLIISDFEYELLTSFFKIDTDLLHYIPFMFEEINSDQQNKFPSFDERQHFISIGNFLHEPNWDAVKFLKSDIWKSIKKQIPEAELHIYGAYSSPKVEQLHNEKEGFCIKGRAESAEEVIRRAKVLLAPIRFGAGLKGKLVDAMKCGTPSVTTAIGAEGMITDQVWGGEVAETPEQFVKKAIDLYNNPKKWSTAQKTGFSVFNSLFSRDKHHQNLKNKISFISSNLSEHRKKNFIGSMLLQNTLQSYKYMSKWIEEKNKNL